MTDIALEGQMRTHSSHSPYRLVLQEDAMEWLTDGQDHYRFPSGRLNVARVAGSAELDRRPFNRVVKGQTLYPAQETVAALIHLGTRNQGVEESEAYGRLFRVVNIAKLGASQRALAA